MIISMHLTVMSELLSLGMVAVNESGVYLSALLLIGALKLHACS